MLLGGLIRNRIIIMLIRNFRLILRKLILIFNSIIYLTQILLEWTVLNVHLQHIHNLMQLFRILLMDYERWVGRWRRNRIKLMLEKLRPLRLRIKKKLYKFRKKIYKISRKLKSRQSNRSHHHHKQPNKKQNNNKNSKNGKNKRNN